MLDPCCPGKSEDTTGREQKLGGLIARNKVENSGKEFGR